MLSKKIRGRASLQAQQTEREVSGADHFMIQALGFLGAVRKRSFGKDAERNVEGFRSFPITALQELEHLVAKNRFR